MITTSTKQTVLLGNCAEVLKTIPAESVDCCVTSPPYWGLRDYKTEPLVWDASEGCEHEWGEPIPIDLTGGIKSTSGNGKTQPHLHTESCFCSRCGAWRGQLGLEPTPQLYIKHLVSIFDEVKRVLKPSGTCWVNLGDSYGDKSLQQIPSRFAIAMTDRDWCLRNEIIWHKPNCMPSSVKDRFTVDFEKLFFFTKSKRYYFEPQYEPQIDWGLRERSANKYRAAGLANGLSGELNPNGRNKRTVWTISTKPYSGAHFAVFPPELVETPIKAGCPGEICSKCGKAREQIMENETIWRERPNQYTSYREINGQPDQRKQGVKRTVIGMSNCGCGAPFVPGVVLDPFGGSGTTAKVARSLGRSSIIIELNPAYLELATERAMTNVPDVLSFEARGAGP